MTSELKVIVSVDGVEMLIGWCDYVDMMHSGDYYIRCIPGTLMKALESVRQKYPGKF